MQFGIQANPQRSSVSPFPPSLLFKTDQDEEERNRQNQVYEQGREISKLEQENKNLKDRISKIEEGLKKQ